MATCSSRNKKGSTMPTHYKGKTGTARKKALKEHKAATKKKGKKTTKRKSSY
jgi:hypothetical protein